MKLVFDGESFRKSIYSSHRMFFDGDMFKSSVFASNKGSKSVLKCNFDRNKRRKASTIQSNWSHKYIITNDSIILSLGEEELLSLLRNNTPNIHEIVNNIFENQDMHLIRTILDNPHLYDVSSSSFKGLESACRNGCLDIIQCLIDDERIDPMANNYYCYNLAKSLGFYDVIGVFWDNDRFVIPK